MILIIGATGMVGSEICQLLRNRDLPVRAMVRAQTDQSKIDNLLDIGVDIMEGDLRDEDSIFNALSGVNTVITTSSSMPFSYIPGENDIETVDKKGMITLIDCAKNAEVEHFIYTSFSGQIDADFPLRNAKRYVEEYLENSGMVYTILRPSYFMEVWFSPAVGFDTENLSVNLCGDGDQPVSYISYKDVARFAIESIGNLTALNSTLELGGPDMISQIDAVHIFEEITGERFAFSHVTQEDLVAQMGAAEDPMEKSFAGLMLCLAMGDPIDMTETMDKFHLKLTSVREFVEGTAAPSVSGYA